MPSWTTRGAPGHRGVYALVMIISVIASLVLASCSTGQEAATPTAVVSTTNAPTEAAAPTNTNAPVETPTAVSATSNASDPDPDTFVEVETGDIVSLDPAWLYDTASGEVTSQVYESLLMFKRESVTEYVPVLATKWDISQDGKTYTFTLRKGVKFHEGQDLTPEDVAYSLWRGMIQDRAGGPQWIMLQPFLGLDVTSMKDGVVAKMNNDWVAACEAVKKTVTFDNAAGTVTLHLKQAYGPMLQILTGTWGEVVSKQWVTAQKGWDGDCKTAEKAHDPKAEDDELFKTMNGTGPYKFVRWKPGEEVALTRNDSYWRTEPIWEGGPSGLASIKNVVIKIVKEWGTRFATFKNGEADAVYVDSQYISQIDPLVKETCDGKGACTQANASGTLRLFKGLPSTAADTIFFNQGVETAGGNPRLGSGKLDGNGIPPDFFSDIHVRKAFNYCFDWGTYIKDVWHGEAEQALGPIINGELGYDPSQAHYSLDRDKCAAEFKASTLKSADGKSLWDTGFTVQYVYDTGTDNRKTAGEILKDSLGQVNPNFKMDITEEPWPAFLKEMTEGRLGLYMVGWIEDFHDPHDWVTPYQGSNGAWSGTQHFPKDLQAKFDDQITKAAQATDNAERVKMYKELQNEAYENAIDIFLEQPQNRRYQQLWVKGWYYNPTYFGGLGTGAYIYALSKEK